MAKSDVLHDHPRSKKVDAEQREAKKGDVKTGRDFGDDDDEAEWESIGTETLQKDGKIVSPDGLDRSGPPLSVKSLKDIEDLRVKDRDEGHTREWFRRKPGKPTS